LLDIDPSERPLQAVAAGATEYARRNAHADLIRERTDGVTGD
jgi:hypothetical protein